MKTKFKPSICSRQFLKNNKYVLTFHVGGQFDTDVEADIVLLTLPFTTLRDVDIRIPLPTGKRIA